MISRIRVFTRARSIHTLPDLPYAYNALEPFISADIMEIHHKKHHQAYITNLIATEEKIHTAMANNDVAAQIALQPALRFNGGGHINHSIFWKNLAPASEGGIDGPKGALLSVINKDFGSFDAFKSQFIVQAAGVQGSGWAWLALNPVSKRLEVVAMPNQDPLTSHIPLLGVDVWEHAYYLQYKNVRPDYLKAIWHVINWKDVTERAAKAGAL